jgi:hypothetical protein
MMLYSDISAILKSMLELKTPQKPCVVRAWRACLLLTVRTSARFCALAYRIGFFGRQPENTSWTVFNRKHVCAKIIAAIL